MTSSCSGGMNNPVRRRYRRRSNKRHNQSNRGKNLNNRSNRSKRGNNRRTVGNNRRTVGNNRRNQSNRRNRRRPKSRNAQKGGSPAYRFHQAEGFLSQLSDFPRDLPLFQDGDGTVTNYYDVSV